MMGWFYIVWRRPFEVGDRIQIGSHAGDVIDLTMFRFTLAEIGNWVHPDQHTGRIVHIPNGKVFTEPQAVYGKGMKDYIWNEVAILITFESNWRKARDILQAIGADHGGELAEAARRKIDEYAKDFLIGPVNLMPTVFISVQASGVLLTLRHICEYRERRESTDRIWELVLDRFSACEDIDLAYPTSRSFNNTVEGKAGCGRRETGPGTRHE